jgi:hypothetical protein
VCEIIEWDQCKITTTFSSFIETEFFRRSEIDTLFVIIYRLIHQWMRSSVIPTSVANSVDKKNTDSFTDGKCAQKKIPAGNMSMKSIRRYISIGDSGI